MIKGFFIENTPFIRVKIGYGRSVQIPVAVLDAGFSGDLQINKTIAEQLGIEPIGAIPVKVANGQTVYVGTALAAVQMEEETAAVDVLISDGMPLAGMELLMKFGYKVAVDCKNRTIELGRV